MSDNWLVPRVAAGVVAMLVGGLLGHTIGLGLDKPIAGLLLGGAVATLLVAAADGLRAYRLIAWLRSPLERARPTDEGVWGEVAYRIERTIRSHESATTQEQNRLAQFLSAIEASPNGVLMLDAKDQIDWCNSVASDHFGLDPLRDQRQPVTNLVRAPAFVDCLRNQQFDHAVTFPAPAGHATLSVLVRAYGDGRKIVLSQDITERERADAMRRDFVANVSHEMRTPLTVLAGFVETMAELPLTEVERERVLTLMRQQTTRMQTLVADLLTLAQLEGSPRPPGDLWHAADKLFAQVSAEAAMLSAGRHTLNFQLQPDVELAGHDAELTSALANLVNNAVRYTPEGGRVDVLFSVRGDGVGEIEVRDSGIGIEREHLPRLTERFYRVDGSRSRETGGTGLGLAIVKHVVQRHGGELGVQSQPGVGSSFRILLPAVRVRAAVAAVAT